MKIGSSLKFDRAIDLELKIAKHLFREPDLYEGIRAQVIEKDFTPHWKQHFQGLDLSEYAE